MILHNPGAMPPTKIRAGTSGFSYKPWKGPFYPDGLPDKRMLEYYAERLPTVEINNTFYRMPKAPMLQGWADKVPDGFVFILKASRKITHHGRLKEVKDSVDHLWEMASALGPKLGPILFQLPPHLKKDVPRLQAFAAELPTGCKAAFEFRHESWFDDDVVQCLRDAGQTLCLADFDDKETPELVSTTDWGYLRLRREQYSDDELAAWVERVQSQPWREAFVFFKHEDEGIAPNLALRMMKRALS